MTSYILREPAYNKSAKLSAKLYRLDTLGYGSDVKLDSAYKQQINQGQPSSSIETTTQTEPQISTAKTSETTVGLTRPQPLDINLVGSQAPSIVNSPQTPWSVNTSAPITPGTPSTHEILAEKVHKLYADTVAYNLHKDIKKGVPLINNEVRTLLDELKDKIASPKYGLHATKKKTNDDAVHPEVRTLLDELKDKIASPKYGLHATKKTPSETPSETTTATYPLTESTTATTGINNKILKLTDDVKKAFDEINKLKVGSKTEFLVELDKFKNKKLPVRLVNDKRQEKYYKFPLIENGKVIFKSITNRTNPETKDGIWKLYKKKPDDFINITKDNIELEFGPSKFTASGLKGGSMKPLRKNIRLHWSDKTLIGDANYILLPLFKAGRISYYPYGVKNNQILVKDASRHALNLIRDLVERGDFKQSDYDGLLEDEGNKVNRIIKMSGVHIPSHIKMKGYYLDDINEMKQRYKVLVGEIQAGNHGKLAFEEMKDIVNKLASYNAISNPSKRKMLAEINNAQRKG